MSTISALKPPAWLPQRTRSYTRLSQLWQIPIFFVGVIAIVTVLTGAMLQRGQQQQQLTAELDELRELVEQPGADSRTLVPQIRAFLEKKKASIENKGHAHLLLATVLLQGAEHESVREATRLLQEARGHLDQAGQYGVLPADRPRVWFLLGKTLYQTGKLKEATNYLQRSLPTGTKTPAKGYALLVQAYLRQPQPDTVAALKANRLHLQSTRDPKDRLPAQLLRAELLVRQKQHHDAFKELENLTIKAPLPLRQRARYLQALCCEEIGLWKRAAPLWQELLQTPAQVPGGRRRILYTLGFCYSNITPPNLVLASQAWRQAEREGGAEGQAASVRLAELHLGQRRPQLREVVTHFQNALRGLQSPEHFKNKYVNLTEIEKLISAGIQVGTQKSAFAEAQQLIAMYKTINPGADAEPLFAEVTERWATSLTTEAESLKGAAAKNMAEQAKKQWLGAAGAWQRAAKSQTGDKKSQWLWQSAQCFRKANAHAEAVAVLQQYVRLPLPGEQLAEGWYALAESFQGQDKIIDARQAWLQCLKLPAGAVVGKARYQLAVDLIGRKRFPEAQGLLKQNIDLSRGTIKRTTVENSLYQLAILLYEQQNCTEAEYYLKKAVRDFPANASVYMARDMLADCYYRFGEDAYRKHTKRNTVSPELQQIARRKQQEWMEKAIATYQELGNDLETKKDQRHARGHNPPLTRAEEILLRKALFTVADIEFKLNHFSTALRRYKILAAEYRGRLEELYACHRIWMCCTALQKQPEQFRLALQATRNSLDSVRKILPKIPDEQFEGTKSRQEWQIEFDRIDAQLRQLTTQTLRPPLPPPPAPIAPAPES